MQPPSAPTPALPVPGGPLPRRRMLRAERRGLIVAATSSAIVLAILVVVALLAPGSSEVKQAFFSVTVRMFLLAEVLVLGLALFLALLRGLPGPVFFPFRVLSIAYIDLFRGIPLLLVMFIVGFGLPGMQLGFISRQSQFTYGVISLTLVYSAYVAEVYRAGIESIHESQTSAARALGLSRGQALRFVVLPQAIRRVIPPLLNDFIGLQKDTALVAAIGLVEVVRTAQAYGTTFFNFAGLTVAAALFVLITIPLARFTDYLIRREQRKMRAGGVR
jgi:polar amino acid transport system permease protein